MSTRVRSAVAVLSREGKLLMQSVMATKASAVLDLLKGLRGVLHVTFEEGTYSTWLYGVVVRQVARVVVCNPRKNAVLKLIHVIGLVATVEHFVTISDHRCATPCEGIGRIGGGSITLQVSSPGQTR